MNQTTTTSEAERNNNFFCTICKGKGHTAQHHKDMPDVYGIIPDFKAGFNIMMDYWDLLGLAEKEEAHKRLK